MSGMSGRGPLLIVSNNDGDDEQETSEVEVQWSKIPVPDLQDLLFPSESESESEEEEEEEEGDGMKKLQKKVKVSCDMLLNKKSRLFLGDKMTENMDYGGLAELENMWAQITPQEFVMTMYALGPEAKQKDYLNSLLVEVDPALLPRKQQKHVHNITMLFASTSARWSEQRRPECNPYFNARQPGLVANCSWYDHMGVPHLDFCGVRHRELEVVHRFAYTTARQLFSSSDPRPQAYILKALADSGRSSLGTPMGRALMLDKWLSSRWEFVVELGQAVCYLSFFLWASVKIRHGYVPSRHVLVALCALSVWTVFTKAVEVISALKLFQSLYVMSASLVLMSIEIVNAATTFTILSGGMGHAGQKCEPPECLLMSHLTSLSLSIFFKWAHFISGMLCLRMFGERVLPAAYTMCSAESVRFLIIIGMLVMASFSAYFAFPIPGTVPKLDTVNASSLDYFMEEIRKFHFDDGQFLVPKATFNMMMKMFNLDLMGDFDLLDLEGENKVVRVNATSYMRLLALTSGSHVMNNQTIRLADIVDPAAEDMVHQGVSLLLIVLCLLINVITMNIYIGLLSSVYERYSSQRWELLAEYKTIHVLRGKLSNVFNLLSYFDSTRQAHDFWVKLWPCRPEKIYRAIWFAFRDEEFPAEDGADTAAILAQLDDIRKDVKQLVDRRS